MSSEEYTCIHKAAYLGRCDSINAHLTGPGARGYNLNRKPFHNELDRHFLRSIMEKNNVGWFCLHYGIIQGDTPDEGAVFAMSSIGIGGLIYLTLANPVIGFCIFTTGILSPLIIGEARQSLEKNITKELCEWPPLFFAACNGQAEAAKILLDAGAETSININGVLTHYTTIAARFNQTVFLAAMDNYRALCMKKAEENESLARAELSELEEEVQSNNAELENLRKKYHEMEACQKNSKEEQIKLNTALQYILQLQKRVEAGEEKIKLLKGKLHAKKSPRMTKRKSKTSTQNSRSQPGLFGLGDKGACSSKQQSKIPEKSLASNDDRVVCEKQASRQHRRK